jgi:hypothetical protein
VTRVSVVPFLVATGAVMEQVAFEYGSLGELPGKYARLKAVGVLPVLPVDKGSRAALSSRDFARRRQGVDIHPDNMIAAEGLS